MGQPDAPQLNRVWTAIQADMNRPQPVIRRHSLRFSIAAVVLLVTLLLPWSLNTQQIALAVPSQPQPNATLVTPTAPTGDAATAITLSATDAAIPPAQTPGAP